MNANLLVFTENYARGGGNRYMIDLVNALSDDYASILIASNKKGLFPEDTGRLQHPVLRRAIAFVTRSSLSRSFCKLPVWLRNLLGAPLLALEPLFLIYNVALCTCLIRELKPTHILCCNGGYPAAQACLAMVLAAKLSQVPVVLSIVSMPTPRRTVTWPYEILLDKLVWSAATVVIANAAAIANALCDRRGAPAQKMAIIHNGLEDGPASNVSKKNGDDFVIGCIARMDAAKGVLILFEAFAELAKDHPYLRLVLAGHGDAYNELVKRTEILGLQNRVHLLGHYDGDVNALLETFDVYVFPSLWEGFPYSIIEALRSASTIVATRVGGIPEAITDGVEGVLIAPGSKEEIIEAVRKLMKDPEMRQMLAKNARMKFEHDLALQKMHFHVRDAFARLHLQESGN